MFPVWIYLAYVIGGINAATEPQDPLVVCYVSGWASYRPAEGKFDASNIDPTLCSHLVFAFAGLDPTNFTIKSLDPWNDLEDGGGKGGYKKMTQLRAQRPGLMVSLAVGGWNEGSGNYSAMVAEPQRRRRFIESVVHMLRQHNFDGLDLDWEYPTKRGGHSSDRENFVALVKELRETFEKEQDSGKHWLLTSAIGAAPDVIQSAYDLPALSQYLDYLHIMTYDYHGTWESKVGVNAPLRGTSDADHLSVEKTLDLVLRAGAKAEKVVLGLPFYGRTFVTPDEEQSPALGSPALKEGFPGPYTKERGFMGYNEICAELDKNAGDWQLSWDESSSTPYAVRGKQVISFDNPDSIDIKVRFGMKKGIGGMMVWALDTDDFLGSCSQATSHDNFPLLRAINKALVESLEERENEIQKEATNMKVNTSSAQAPAASFGFVLALLCFGHFL